MHNLPSSSTPWSVPGRAAIGRPPPRPASDLAQGLADFSQHHACARARFGVALGNAVLQGAQGSQQLHGIDDLGGRRLCGTGATTRAMPSNGGWNPAEGSVVHAGSSLAMGESAHGRQTRGSARQDDGRRPARHRAARHGHGAAGFDGRGSGRHAADLSLLLCRPDTAAQGVKVRRPTAATLRPRGWKAATPSTARARLKIGPGGPTGRQLLAGKANG